MSLCQHRTLYTVLCISHRIYITRAMSLRTSMASNQYALFPCGQARQGSIRLTMPSISQSLHKIPIFSGPQLNKWKYWFFGALFSLVAAWLIFFSLQLLTFLMISSTSAPKVNAFLVLDFFKPWVCSIMEKEHESGVEICFTISKQTAGVEKILKPAVRCRLCETGFLMISPNLLVLNILRCFLVCLLLG